MNSIWKRIACFFAGAAVMAALILYVVVEDKPQELMSERVSFSAASGFYDDPFYLELSANGGDIYYTLDSTDPDENSLRYTGPILIRDASPNENVYSMITETSVYLKSSLLGYSGISISSGINHFGLPKNPVDKATVVRAVCIDEHGRRSETSTSVYFVAFGEKTGYDGLRVMSITTAPENLFDYDDGIYVLGSRFYNTLDEDYKIEQSSDVPIWKSDANYRQKGSEWEREAWVNCFDADGSQIISGNYGIRVQGGYSRSGAIKNLNIFARDKYGSDLFDGNRLFGLSDRLSRINLSSGANDRTTLLKDYLVNTFIYDRNIGAREYVPCALFLDGEFWGIYWMTPRHKADYLSQKYGVGSSNIVCVKDKELEVGKDEDIDLYNDLIAFVADNDMSLPQNYDRVCERVDIESCIEYYAVEIYVSNYDWPANNTSMWRTRVTAPGRFADSRWRWLIYDVNVGMRKGYADFDMLSFAINEDAFLASLMKNPGFEKALYARLVEMARDTFEPEKVRVFVDEYKNAMSASMEKDYERIYCGTKTLDDFYESCDIVANFFKDRSQFIIDRYGDLAS